MWTYVHITSPTPVHKSLTESPLEFIDMDIFQHYSPNPGLLLQACGHHGSVGGASPQSPPPQHPGLSLAFLTHPLVCYNPPSPRMAQTQFPLQYETRHFTYFLFIIPHNSF